MVKFLSRLSGHGQFLSGFPVPPPHSTLLTNKIFYVLRIIKILSSCAKKISWHILIKFCQDLIKMFQEKFVYQDLGKMSQVLQWLSRSCMTRQGVSSFDSLEGDCLLRQVLLWRWVFRAAKRSEAQPLLAIKLPSPILWKTVLKTTVLKQGLKTIYF